MEIAQQTDKLELTLHFEKIQGKGEDATPTLKKEGNYVLLSVYDGMGGAGSTTYEKEGNKTGAAIAAELAKKVNEELFSTLTALEEFSLTDYPRQLESKLKEVFKEEINRLDIKTSRLKSSLIKRLPTTLAGIIADISDNRNIKLVSFWAGDSRNFIIDGAEGMLLLSKDDITSKGDSSTIDAPLSNCINADTDFFINSKIVNRNGKIILLSATDGCFGYFNTLPQFEHLILHSIDKCDGVIESIKDQIFDEIKDITQDDFSLSLIVLGYNNFPQIKSDTHLNIRLRQLEKWIDKLKFIETKLLQKQKEKETLENDKQTFLKEVWDQYKLSFESLISEQ